MKFIAILILLYFMLGFLGAIAICESRRKVFIPPKPSVSENPPLEVPLEILLLGILLGLPVLGYKRAKKQGEFLRFTPRVWLVLPPLLLVSGFLAGFLAFRYL
jgi:hypothetical protein